MAEPIFNRQTFNNMHTRMSDILNKYDKSLPLLTDTQIQELIQVIGAEEDNYLGSPDITNAALKQMIDRVIDQQLPNDPRAAKLHEIVTDALKPPPPSTTFVHSPKVQFRMELKKILAQAQEKGDLNPLSDNDFEKMSLELEKEFDKRLMMTPQERSAGLSFTGFHNILNTYKALPENTPVTLLWNISDKCKYIIDKAQG